MTTSNFAQVKYTLHLYVKIIMQGFLKGSDAGTTL